MKFALPLLVLLFAWIGWRAWRTGPLPLAGERAPDFSLPDQHDETRTLASYAGRWLVLYFYPRDDTPGCTQEACAFRDGLQQLEAAGAAVAGVSVDTAESHRRFAGKYSLPFDLLADADGAVARRYGVLMDWKLLRLAKRATFLIGPDGVVRKVYPRVDPKRHAGQVLADIAGFSTARFRPEGKSP